MDHYAEIRNPVAYKFRIIKSHKLWKLILCAIYKYFGCSINLFEFYRHCNSIIQMKTSFSRKGAMNPSPGPLNTVLTLKKMNDLLWLAVLKPPKCLHLLSVLFLIVLLPCLSIVCRLHCAVSFCWLYFYHDRQICISCNHVCLLYIHNRSHTCPSLCILGSNSINNPIGGHYLGIHKS